jgi:copper(I)-binding protein
MILRTTLLAATLTVLTGTAAFAHDAAISVEGAWTRATAPSAKNGGAFMTVRNAGPADDRLVAAASPAAARAELHTHTMTDGVMRMRPVAGGIAVPAGGVTELKPGGLHVMLLGLAAPLAEGTTIPVTLTFEHAGRLTVEVPVMEAGAAGPGPAPMDGHGKMNMPHDPAPHSAPVMTPGGGMVRP